MARLLLRFVLLLAVAFAVPLQGFAAGAAAAQGVKRPNPNDPSAQVPALDGAFVATRIERVAQ